MVLAMQVHEGAKPNHEDKPWVLVVDDSRVVRRAITKILGDNYHVLEAADGMAGWRMLRQNSRVELIISDIQMPELDGYSLICKIRAVDDPGLRELPIIVITSADDDITRERAYACGENDFILKPFNASQLTECVQAQFSEHAQAGGSIAEEIELPGLPGGADVEAEEIVVPDTNSGSVATAMEYLDAGLSILRNLKTNEISPQALSLVIRVLPLIKYCNTHYKLDMDKEITVIQERVAGARNRTKAEV